MDLLSLFKIIHIWLVNILIIFFIIRAMVSIVIKDNEVFVTNKVFTIIFYLSISIIITGIPLLLNYISPSNSIFYSKIILAIVLFTLLIAKHFNRRYHDIISNTLIVIIIISVYTLSLFLGLITS